MKEKSTKKRLFLNIIAIIGAWLSTILFGLFLFFITTFSTIFDIYSGSINPPKQTVSLLVLNGILGIIILILMIKTLWSVRYKIFVKHTIIGLWIGVVLYTIIAIFGFVNNMSIYNNEQPDNICTTIYDQYQKHASAIVPIATDIGTGTGFAVRDSQTVLTAYHVIEGASTIYANYSSGKVSLTIITTAPQYDLVLLKIEKPTNSFFNLSSEYGVGDEIYVYGYPGNTFYAGPPSLNAGIISRVLSSTDLKANFQDAPDRLEMIQTDAAINPGNSGGPLIGKCGVIGIVNSVSDSSQLHSYIDMVSEQNIGYAISSKSAAAELGINID